MESRHNKNIANLQFAVINFSNLGSEYAPPQDLVKLPDLQTALTISQIALCKINEVTPETDESRTTQSQSQKSPANQIAYLADISALLKTRSEYKDDGTPYSVTEVDAKIAALTAKHNTANTADAVLGSKLDARDAVMYNDATGIIPRIKLIKPYLILKFGKDSTIYQEINALEFRKVK